MTDNELKQVNVPLPKGTVEEGIELDDEQLERIAGGKLTEQDAEQYKEIMGLFKKKGWTKAKFLDGYDYLSPEEQADITELVEKYW